jgi:hypothetical protein
MASQPASQSASPFLGHFAFFLSKSALHENKTRISNAIPKKEPIAKNTCPLHSCRRRRRHCHCHCRSLLYICTIGPHMYVWSSVVVDKGGGGSGITPHYSTPMKQKPHRQIIIMVVLVYCSSRTNVSVVLSAGYIDPSQVLMMMMMMLMMF